MKSSKWMYLIIGIVVGLILGVLLGMALFWGPFAVEWTDAHSYDLSPEGRAEYMALVADSFNLDKDPAQAEAFLAEWTPEEKQQAVEDAIKQYEEEGRADKAQALEDLALALAIAPPAETPETPPTETPPTPPEIESPVSGIWNRLRVPCLVFVLVLLVLVLALIAVRALLRRGPSPGDEPAEQPVSSEATTVGPGDAGRAPLGHFFTTYQLGEDTYDESFSIEASTGEFLGECGMGISETIGDGEPDKVTAFEVWLFDKSDIRTVTKVLMSEYAFHDEALRGKLAPKGEAVLAEPGSPLILETTGLRVRVDVTELVYGEGELPPQSFFAKVMVEMLAVAKPTEAETSTSA
jgi:hypothetical protein